MHKALLPLLVVLMHSSWITGVCIVKNDVVAQCQELQDVKRLESQHFEKLTTVVSQSVLSPGLFDNLTNLRHLDLSLGNIESIEPGTFDKLVHLKSLILAKNRIKHLELDSLSGLDRLHSLNLRKNKIRQLPPVLATLKSLRHLKLDGNPLQCNCATLRTRDLITQRHVNISNETICDGPATLKRALLLELDAATVCQLEEQDREMQNDQPKDDSLDEYGSGNSFPEDENSAEFSEVVDNAPEPPKELEVETPFPQVPETTTAASILEEKPAEPSQTSSSGVAEAAVPTEASKVIDRPDDNDNEIFFESEEKKEPPTTAATEKKKVYKDALFYPVESSGDGDEGSGEGSGTEMVFGNWHKIGVVEQTSEKDESSSSSGLLDQFFNIFRSTAETTTASVDPDLEEEQFIDASLDKEEKEEVFAPRKIPSDDEPKSATDSAVVVTNTTTTTDAVEIVDNELHDLAKLGNVMAEEEETTDDISNVSPAKQSKKGMGSYVVLVALLAILASLIGFAAYKGDFCRKGRKRGDVETGTELKDMQKALLETSNSTQPKIASNGNVENVPLVEDVTDHDELKMSNDRQVIADIPKFPNGTSDRSEPMKPPRTASPQEDPRTRQADHDGSSLKDDSLSVRSGSMDQAVNNSSIGRLSDVNVPPLSPGAQRVKITLQENPDSVPKTPILITRTMAGENLVKTP